MKLTEREIELLEGMIEVHLSHAKRAAVMNSPMGKKQYGWDMERVILLTKIIEDCEEI